MSRHCELTGVGPKTGNLVSHSNIKTRTRWLPNLKDKRYFISELGQTLTLRLSSRAIRTIDKQGGISAALRKARPSLLSERLQNIQRKILNSSGRSTQTLNPASRANSKSKE